MNNLTGATIFLSAFLLFQVQPLLGKLILPWFGGSAAVWTSCMLFFQLALLSGYGYAHWLSRQPGKRQTLIHTSLLVLSLLSLPILPAEWWKPVHGENPLIRIPGLLAATAGLPFLLLSSTSPLLQSWTAAPWRFFALSNAGSMAGLWTYPLLMEPYLTNRKQAWLWSGMYTVFTVVCGTVAWRKHHPATRGRAQPFRHPAQFTWLALAACASALLLAITNYLTQNIAAIPFLWVLPLSLYLLSFILCFDNDRWYPRELFAWLAAIALPALAWAISDIDNLPDLKTAIVFVCAAVFVLFMVCHGELARRKPAPASLTSFYLTIAAGGAIGGTLVGFAAPALLNANYDPYAIVSLTGFLFVVLLWQKLKQHVAQTVGKLVVAGLLVAYCALLTDRFSSMAFAAMGAVALAAVWLTQRTLAQSAMLYVLSVGLAAGVSGYLIHEASRSVSHSVALTRNFYGALIVFDSPSGGDMGLTRVLRHGAIEHGEQFLDARYQRYPTAYYATNSGVGLGVRTLMAEGPVHVGMIGLGAGTLLAYARAGDRYSIYEINPDVVRLAQTQFTFLTSSPAPYSVIPGDARLSLTSETESRNFDLLAVDAFSGDAIPLHLLTREAFALYWRHLKPDGVLAIHVTNRYLSLAPTVAAAATETGKEARMISSPATLTKGELASDWVLVTSRPGFFAKPQLASSAQTIEPIAGLPVWTDQYSNLLRVLK